MWKYWRSVLSISWETNIEFFETHKKKTIIGYLGAMGGTLLLQYFLLGWEEMVEEFVSTFIPFLIPIPIFMLLWVWNFIRTPSLLAEKSEQKKVTLSAKLNTTMRRHQEDKQKLDSALEEMASLRTTLSVREKENIELTEKITDLEESFTAELELLDPRVETLSTGFPIIRLGLKNLGKSTINGIKVRLEEAPGVGHLPLTLHLMHDNNPWGEMSREGFTVTSEQTEWIDIVLLRSDQGHIELVTADGNISLSEQSYSLTIVARSPNSQPAEATMEVGIDDNGALSYELETPSGEES